ncbi:bZIP transcription factor 1 [Phytophthora nicotianae]|uniref:BZIP transcription factor 1 n=1 Tax=Phytophthora nicotianae TaxID=4792 RepID=A0A0W8D4E3_PHYNI|nr:bZIP transcription factor 1 [Phytophthora nicotianae]
MRAASSPMEPLNKNILLAGEVIAEKWKIGEKIGEGTFSQIYSAYSIESRDKVAVKVEAPSSLKPVLEWESLILKSLQDCPYVDTIRQKQEESVGTSLRDRQRLLEINDTTTRREKIVDTALISGLTSLLERILLCLSDTMMAEWREKTVVTVIDELRNPRERATVLFLVGTMTKKKIVDMVINLKAPLERVTASTQRSGQIIKTKSAITKGKDRAHAHAHDHHDVEVDLDVARTHRRGLVRDRTRGLLLDRHLLIPTAAVATMIVIVEAGK